MVARITPQQAIADPQAARLGAMQNQAMQLGLQRKMVGDINRDLNQVTDFLDRKNILDQLAQQPQQPVYNQQAQALGAPQPQEAPQSTPEEQAAQEDALLDAGGLVDESKEAEFQMDTQPLADPEVSQEEMVTQLQGRATKLKQQGRDAKDTEELIQIAIQDPAQAKLAIGNINQMIQNKAVRRFMARNPEGAKEFLTGLGATGMDGKTVDSPYSKMQMDLMKKQLESQLAEDVDLRDEKRGEISKLNTAIDADISSINKNYQKVQNLLKVVSDKSNPKGARQAVAGLLVSLVKLGDPNSAVLAGEMAAALNLQGIEGALLSRDPDVIKSAILGKLDALNPENVDPDGIMKVANAYRAAGVSDLDDRYSYIKEQRGFLGEGGKKQTFSKRREDMLSNLKNSTNKSLFSSAPDIGATEDGERYLGGDPANPESWEAL